MSFSGGWGNFRSRGVEGAFSTIGEARQAFLRLIRKKETIAGECVESFTLNFRASACHKSKLSITAEAVEKVRMKNFDNYSILKNQLLTSHKRLQNGLF
jgi:hypothetical protein